MRARDNFSFSLVCFLFLSSGFYLVLALVARVCYCFFVFFLVWSFKFIYANILHGCGAAEATGFVCFVVINPCVLSANRVDLGFFYFINFPILLPPPPSGPNNKSNATNSCASNTSSSKPPLPWCRVCLPWWRVRAHSPIWCRQCSPPCSSRNTAVSRAPSTSPRWDSSKWCRRTCSRVGGCNRVQSVRD